MFPEQSVSEKRRDKETTQSIQSNKEWSWGQVSET